MHRGYIKIWRKFQDSFLYSDSEAVHLWVHLLLNINHKDKEFMFNNKKQICKKGSMLTGLNKLSDATGINRSKINRLLKTMESETLIETLRNNKFSIITVVNWSEHQEVETQNETPVELQRNSSETPVKTNKHLKHLSTKEESKEKNNKKEKLPKQKFGEFENVFLTSEDLTKLFEKFGEQKTKNLIESMSSWLARNGKKYKNYYAALLNWAKNESNFGGGEEKKYKGKLNDASEYSHLW